MDLRTVLSVSGKPGLFKLISHQKSGVVVESLLDGKRTAIPSSANVSSLGDIDSDGSMKGSLSHLDLDLNLKSDQGNIDSEIFINWSDDLDDIEYNGGISFYDFNIDFFENRFGFKKLNGQINVDGKGDDISNFDTQISGNIKSLNIRDRQYDNIILNGRLQPNYFKGDAFVSDEDLEVEFSGEVDFSNKKPIMDFVANLIEVDLVKLNLYNQCLKIEIVWDANGTSQNVDLRDMYYNHNEQNKKPEEAIFLFTGSRMIEKTFMAEHTGSILGVYVDPDAIINSIETNSDNDDLWLGRKSSMPPLENKVTCVLHLP